MSAILAKLKMNIVSIYERHQSRLEVPALTLSYLITGVILALIGTIVSLYFLNGEGAFRDKTSPEDVEHIISTSIFHIAIFTGFVVSCSHAILLVIYASSSKISKKSIYAMDYTYLLFASIGLFTIAPTVIDLNKSAPTRYTVDHYNLTKRVGEKTAEVIEKCDKRIPQKDASKLVEDVCAIAGDVDYLINNVINDYTSNRVVRKLNKIIYDESVLLRKLYRDERRPLDIIMLESDNTVRDATLSGYADSMRDTMENFAWLPSGSRGGEAYTMPTQFQGFRFFAVFVIAYALAIRICKLTSEVLGIVA